jgi:preprotein translocase subunit YajC
MSNPVYAQAVGAVGKEAFNFMSFIPMILIIGVMYFLLIRPQQKKARQHQEMLKAVRRGDKVVTTGGIIATVVKDVNEQELLVEIADNVRVRLMRAMVADVLSHGTGTDSAHGAKSDDAAKETPSKAKVTSLKTRASLTKTKSQKNS